MCIRSFLRYILRAYHGSQTEIRSQRASGGCLPAEFGVSSEIFAECFTKRCVQGLVNNTVISRSSSFSLPSYSQVNWGSEGKKGWSAYQVESNQVFHLRMDQEESQIKVPS